MKPTLLILIACIISLSVSAQHHWESIILAENTWSYFEGNSEPETNWKTIAFDDNTWKQGSGGIGYEDNDDATVIATVASLYLRKDFHISDLNTIKQLVLDIDYDDGFIAYLNGAEVARSSNVEAQNPAYNAGTSIYREAQMYSGGSAEQYNVSMGDLVAGTNVLAIHILNYTATSSDLSALVYLQAQINSSSTIYQEVPSWFNAPINYSSSTLPIIKITTDNQSIIDDPKITAHLGIINNGANSINNINDAFTDYDGYIGIETRGQSSQYFFPKKSYGFETRDSLGENLNVNLLGMPKENDWVLYAPYSDKSMMRNVITFEMAKALDMYSSRTIYCELFLNEEYQGIYILMEKIKRDDSRVDIDSLVTISGDDNSLTGGYIFKVDKKDDFTNLYTGWITSPNPSYPNAMDITYQYVYPKVDDISNSERTYLKDHVTLAEKVLISNDFDNRESGYNHYLNLGSFVDFMLINEVSKEVDKYRYSTYFHKKKDSKGGEIYAGPIWDFNLGYGNIDYWDDGNLTSGWLYADVKNVDYSIMFWWKRLMEDTHFNSIATERYAQLREEKWSDTEVTYLIDSISALVYDAQERNYTRWPILGTYVWPNKLWANMSYNDEVESFKSWILARLAWMDNNMNGAVITPSVVAEWSEEQNYTDVKTLDINLEDQYFNHAQLKTKYFDIKGDGGLLSVDTVIYNNAHAATLLIKGSLSTPISIEVDDNILTGFQDLVSNPLEVIASIDEAHLAHFTLYPNPAHDIINIASENNIIKATLLSLSGQSVISIEGNHIKKLNISELNAGYYILDIRFENGGKQSEKVIKQ